ncbi:MAG: CHAT domain-containing protein [Pseudonocardia sp.]
MATPGDGWVVDPGSPFGLAVRAARTAFVAGDEHEVNRQFPIAVRLAPVDQLGIALAVEHVTKLRQLEDSTAALDHCEQYLRQYPRAVRLHLVRAETRVSRGDYSWIAADLAEIRRLAAVQSLTPEAEALFIRLDGLAAEAGRKFSLALTHLRDAVERYRALGDEAGADVVEIDFRRVATRSGTGPAEVPAEVSADAPVSARLARSEELRMLGRYQEALTEIEQARAGPVDPAQLYFVLEAEVRLCRALYDDERANGLIAALYEAAASSAQPEENRRLAERLDGAHTGRLETPVSADRRLQHVRRLVKAGLLNEAERLLLAEREPPEPDDRHAAEWHLAAGELTIAIAEGNGAPEVADQAVGHLRKAAQLAAAESLVPIRIAALQLRGHAHCVRYKMLSQRRGHTRRMNNEISKAVEAWAEAHHLEEKVAGYQPTDSVRIRMLRGAPDEFDMQIEMAHQAIQRGDQTAVASLVIAIEAARGAAMLPRILPQGSPAGRNLPLPGDVPGARRWIRRAVRGLPRSQVVWLVHATPKHVHYVLVSWRKLRHFVVACDRNALSQKIDALGDCWINSQTLERCVATGEFDEHLSAVARDLGIDTLPVLPARVSRIAVVAGGDLSEIPFAALPCPGRTDDPDELLGRRYALSDLSCLSVRQPLRQRARRQRGLRMLLLEPSVRQGRTSLDDELSPAAMVPGREVLSRQRATPAALREALADGYHEVRIDSHGKYRREGASTPALMLWPRGLAGEVCPGDLESMHLGATGTLVLGACETGMATRIGRDERTGFVRAALLAGSSAVLAARWATEDEATARVLDSFEANLRYHPRDVALHLAVREEDRGGQVSGAHPTRWVPWTLYGDTGHQTRHGPGRRWLLRRWELVRPWSCRAGGAGDPR